MERGPTHDAEVTSPDLSNDGFHKSDDVGDGLSPVSSQYSSCGESEFERYCSANSVMGTPSMCSSMGMYHDFVDSDFGSVKSLEGFTLGSERFSGSFQEKRCSILSGEPGFGDSHSDAFCGLTVEDEKLSSLGKMKVVDNGGSSISGYGTSIDGGMPMLGSKGGEVEGVKVFDGGKNEDLAVLLKNVESVLLQGAVAARSAAENLLDSNHADEMEDERCGEKDDDTSSRYEHSEGEDSMFDYGSDSGSRPSAYYVRNEDQRHDEDAGNGSLVLMNPSVAFGSNDWEDFELEGGDNTTVARSSDNLWERQQLSDDNGTNTVDFTAMMPTFSGNCQWNEQERNEVHVTAAGDDLQGVDKSFENHLDDCSAVNSHCLNLIEAGAPADIGDTSGTCKQIHSNDESDEYLEGCSVHNIFEKQCPLTDVRVDMGLMKGDCGREEDTTRDKASDHDDHPFTRQNVDPLHYAGDGEASFSSMDACRDLRLGALEGDKLESTEYVLNPVSSSFDTEKRRTHDDKDPCEDEFTAGKGKDCQVNAFYDELVHEMEEILLDSCESHMTRLKQRNTAFHSEQSSPLRDGGSTASTSGLDDEYPLTNRPLVIDEIEVVGAKQRKGDISLSERLVGVREYTVYIIRIWSGNNKWEIERRYRDFYSLYSQLKTLFAAKGWVLPPPWSSVDRESKKFFGNCSPDVIAERSTLIQECLCSILQSRYYSSPPSALIWFLSPPEALLGSFQSNALVDQSTPEVGTERVSSLGKTISLIVEIRPQRSVKELLDAQRYTCAGCRKSFDNGKTRVQEIVQTFGWGKPRFCEYTGQLFCSSCHTNDSAVLPAKVLHHWDFTPYPVSQLAKSYLDSIVDQPMLCVSAANPLLFSRVPTLLHIVGVRRKIGAMLPYIRCSFRRSIYRRLGYRKYLLETTDFFALRDLIDLSKGAFAALPAILEAVVKKIQEHITELCLECCDHGVPCSARQACDNPASLIFPFQEEEEVKNCKSCKSVFHKHCFDKLFECPCGAVLKAAVDKKQSTTNPKLGNVSGVEGSLSMLPKKSESRSPVGFLSNLFSVARQEKMKGSKEGGNVILMGSLPGSSL